VFSASLEILMKFIGWVNFSSISLKMVWKFKKKELLYRLCSFLVVFFFSIKYSLFWIWKINVITRLAYAKCILLKICFIFHFSIIFIIVEFVRYLHDFECSTGHLVHSYLSGLMVFFALTVAVDYMIVRVSMRGTIVDDSPRKNITKFLYTRLVILVTEFFWTIYGNISFEIIKFYRCFFCNFSGLQFHI
jgi:hypothetical protein